MAKLVSFCAGATLATALKRDANSVVQHLARAHDVSETATENKYYWPHARGHVGKYSTSEFHGPHVDITKPSWSWHHPEGRYHTTTLGAVVDDKKNIYLAAEDGIRKFTNTGELVWKAVPSRGHGLATCPSLMDGKLFGNVQGGWVYALDMESGGELWMVQKSEWIGGDTAYVESYDGVVVAGANPDPSGGAMSLFGLDAKDGATLWEYKSTEVLWNVMGVFPGDDSVVVMDVHGGVHKHALHNDTLLWKAKPSGEAAQSFSDGGVIVAPNGDAYTCSNYQGTGQHGQPGALRAFRSQDGAMLWERKLDYPCNSWPAVTSDGATVVVPSGEFVASPAADTAWLMQAAHMNKSKMSEVSLSLGEHELDTYKMPNRTASVKAFDARTGEPKWSTELPPYGRLSSRGDEEGYLERARLRIRNQCLPAQFGSPTIDADGTVWVGRADGKLYAVESGTGKFTTYDAGTGFLHPGTSWAPGFMAIASCDGLLVWNY